MSETPRTDEAEKKRIGWEVRKIASVSGGPPMAGDDTPPKRGWEVARDLERQLAERDAQLAEARTALKRIGWVNGHGIPKHSREADAARAALARIDANAKCAGTDASGNTL